MISRTIVLLALGLVAGPVFAQPSAPALGPATVTPRALNADEQAALRCAAAFAIVAAEQARGDRVAAQYPPLGVRGREFFVVTAARLMDEAGLDETGIKAAAEGEAAAVRRDGVAPIIPFCLALLDAQLPPAAGRAAP